jgi:ABC-type multidrug transport system permease subunit
MTGTPAALGWIIRLNPVSYGVDALRYAVYLPESPPLSLAPFWVSLGVTAAFALAMFLIAVRVVRRGAG